MGDTDADIGCHWLPFVRDLHSSLAVIAVIFGQNGSIAPGHADRAISTREELAQRQAAGRVLGTIADEDLGSGRIVVSEIEAPIMLANLV